MQSVPGRFGVSSLAEVSHEETPVNATEVQSAEMAVGIIESSSARAETEASVSSLTEDRTFLPNNTQVKSMKMIEIPRPKKMLLPTFDMTDDYEKPTKENLTLKKIIKTLKEDMRLSFSEDDESTSVGPEIGTSDRPGESLPRESTHPVSMDAPDSKLNVDVVAKNRPTSSSESESTAVRSKMRLADGSVPGIVKVRMQNTSVIEGGATRLIYSVHLDGKPVPAETAARDMALLSPQEVALELGAPVIIQSEREWTTSIY